MYNLLFSLFFSFIRKAKSRLRSEMILQSKIVSDGSSLCLPKNKEFEEEDNAPQSGKYDLDFRRLQDTTSKFKVTQVTLLSVV